MAKTNTGLVAHALAQIGLPYVYGTYGKALTADIVRQKAKQYPTQMYASREEYALKHFLGKRSYDCAGLVKSYMFQETPTAVPKYSEKYDKNVGGLIKACTETGKMSTMPEIPGLLVFRKNEHVGIYAGNGIVIEAKGFDYGVVKSKLSAGKWDKWGKLGWISYEPKTGISGSNKPETAQKTSDKTTTSNKEEIFVAEKTFKNTSGNPLDVFPGTKSTVKIGTLFAGSTCKCLAVIDGMALIKYKVTNNGETKVGFVKYTKGVI